MLNDARVNHCVGTISGLMVQLQNTKQYFYHRHDFFVKSLMIRYESFIINSFLNMPLVFSLSEKALDQILQQLQGYGKMHTIFVFNRRQVDHEEKNF
jgi:hypothetical protein